MHHTELTAGRSIVILISYLSILIFSAVGCLVLLEVSLLIDPALSNPAFEAQRQAAFAMLDISAIGQYYLTLSTIVWQVWAVFAVAILGGWFGLWGYFKSSGVSRMSNQIKAMNVELEQSRVKLNQHQSLLSDLNRQLVGAFQNPNDALLLLNKAMHLEHWNESAQRQLQKWQANLPPLSGQMIWQVAPLLKGTNLKMALSQCAEHGTPWEGEIRLENQRWLLARCWPLLEGIAVFWEDITDVKQPKQLDSVSRQLLEQVVNTLPSPCAVLDISWNYLLTSPAWSKQFGLDENVKGLNHTKLVPQFPANLSKIESEISAGRTLTGRAEKFTLNGQEEFIDWQVAPWQNTEGTLGGYVLQARLVTNDVLARQRSESARAAEQKLAYHDTLTGLPNRQLFQDRLNMALATAYRQLNKVTLMFLDLDGFKAVNDNLGHDAGDMLLKEVARRLKDTLRDTDTVARLGGDEFTLILTNLGDFELIEKVAQKIISSIAAPYDLAGSPANISTSIGISVYPNDGTTATDLIKRADAAMYEAKQAGKNTWRFHDKTAAQQSVAAPAQPVAEDPAQDDSASPSPESSDDVL